MLHGLSLDVRAGHIVVILGRNGMGKTTLIRSIAGLPHEGEIVFQDSSLIGKTPYAIAQSGVAIVPQGRRIFGFLSVRENLLLPTTSLAGHNLARKKPGGWDMQRALAEFPQLVDRLENWGNQLSGGEQQMPAIARALMANPPLILMDEPSEGLSPKLVQKVAEIMLRLRSEGHAILLVEQNLALAMAVADRIYVLSSGSFVFQGTPSELSGNPEILDGHLGVSLAAPH